jgi:hypothetical protein
MSEVKYEVEKGVARKAMRPEGMRDEDPRARAERRAAEIRANRGDTDIDSTDEFFISKDLIPEGWSYEWKRNTLLGQRDPSYEVQLARGGWEAVPASRHPEMMPLNTKSAIIERKGMILMERPLSLTNEARDVELRRAKMQVRAKEAQLAATPDGTMTREHDRVRPTVKKSYDPFMVPDDK